MINYANNVLTGATQAHFAVKLRQPIDGYKRMTVVALNTMNAFTSATLLRYIGISVNELNKSVVPCDQAFTAMPTFMVPMNGPAGGVAVTVATSYQSTSSDAITTEIDNLYFDTLTFSLSDSTGVPLVYDGSTTGYFFEMLLRLDTC